MADIEKMVENLSQEQKKALVKKIKNKSINYVRNIDEYIPLASAQRRLWLTDQINPEAGNQNTAGVMIVSGAFDVDRMKDSIVRVQRRHEILRTAIFVSPEGVVQKVLDRTSLDY